VATLERSYSDPSKNTITFTNYAILTADDQLRELQNIVNQLPTNATIGTIVTNVVNAANAEIKQQLVVALTSADGKNTIYYDAKPSTAKENDTAFVKNADGVTEIWRFHNGAWELDIGVATKEQVDQAIKDMDTDVKAAKQQADDAVSAATDAVAKADFASDAAEQAKTIANGVATQAANALDAAQTAADNATTALSNAEDALKVANGANTTVAGLQQDVDAINAKWSSLATQTDVDALKGTVEDQATTIGQTVAGLALKADKSTVDTITGDVSRLRDEVDIQAGQLSEKITATDVTGMLSGYATETWSQQQILATKNEISASVETVKNTVDNLQIGGRNYVLNSNHELNGGGTSSQLAPFTPSSDLVAAISGKFITISFDIDIKNAVVGSLSNRAGFSFACSRAGGDSAYFESWYNPTDYGVTYKGRIYTTLYVPNDAIGLTADFGLFSQIQADSLILSRPKVSISTVKDDWTPAPEDQATVDWTKSQLDIKDGKISAAVTSLKSDITNATAGMATQTWTQGKLDLTANTLTSRISSVQSSVDNMQIGGRNYLLNSDRWITAKNQSITNLKLSIPTSHLSGKVWIMSFEVEITNVTEVASTGLNRALFEMAIPRTDGSYIYVGPSWNNPKLGDSFKDRISLVVDLTGEKFIDSVDNTILEGLYVQGINAESIKVGRPKIELGSHLTDWSPAPEDQATVVDVSSQITQLQNDINLRVKTGVLIQQINLSTEGILIDGSKTHITNTTTIDNGVIKNAMIADATINGAKIVDASILSAKIANLDGSKIVANSITADKLSADAVLVGLNNGGYGWKFTPEHLGFFQSGATAPSLQLDPEGIVFADVVSMRKLGINYGGPYSVGVDKSYSGIITQMTYGGADFWGVNVEESGGANWNPIMYSRKQMDTFGIFSGLNISAATHFNTIGPMDADAKAQMKVVRAQVGGRWSTGFMNSNANAGNQSGILFTDDGATYLGRAGRWYNLFDIVNKLGLGV
jgi:hypothetical protein